MLFSREIRYAVRSLLKSPGFAVAALLTLALGIGAASAIFSVCDAMLWKPVPLPHMESLVMVLQAVPGDPRVYNYETPADALDIRAQSDSFESAAMFQQGLANIVTGGGEPERANESLVGANLFDVLGVTPEFGRTFRPGDDAPGANHLVILSDAYWRRRFGADPSLVGKTIRLDDRDATVIGIMPDTVNFPLPTDVWTPLFLTLEQQRSRVAQSVIMIARLKPGRALSQAAAEVDGISRRLEAQYPDTNKNRRFRTQSALDFLISDYTKQYALMLFWSVVFVLLIACANVANLQYARATGRAREIALRTALGASRWRLILQVVLECVALSLGGAVAGLGLAKWGIDMIRAGMPARVGQYVLGWDQIHLDLRTMAFMVVAALAAGIIAGLAPAWQCSRPNLNENLRDGGRGASTGRARRRLRSILVGAEIALAVVLLVGASLMVRGFQALVQGAVNLEPASLLCLRVALTETKYQTNAQTLGFYDEALRRMNAIRGVKSAVAVTALPYSGHSTSRLITIEGRPIERGEQPNCQLQNVSPGYFETLRVPLRAGRLLGASDGPDAPRVGVISQRMANQWWPNQSPIGKRVKFGAPDSKEQWITIAGIVGDVTHDVYDRNPRAVLYVPMAQYPRLWMDIAVRTQGDPLRVAPEVAGAIRAISPEQPISDFATLETWMHERATGLNYMAVLMGIFGILALVLSSVGVYGVMAYVVSEQTPEIGIRMALGAARSSVLAMVFRRGMITTLAGLIVGTAVAAGFAHLLAFLVYGVSESDPATFIGIPAALLAAAGFAIYIPARRAMRIDPISALRYE
jgi:putative ABC transport system permease protein